MTKTLKIKRNKNGQPQGNRAIEYQGIAIATTRRTDKGNWVTTMLAGEWDRFNSATLDGVRAGVASRIGLG